jgi:hypothetical protein
MMRDANAPAQIEGDIYYMKLGEDWWRFVSRWRRREKKKKSEDPGRVEKKRVARWGVDM